MESTHDLDFVFWLLEPAKPVRVYSQGAYGFMKDVNGSYDVMWTTVTMDNGTLVAIGGGWNLPPSYPNYCATWIEITGTEGSLFLDDTQRDNWLNTVAEGTRFPMSTMPGEQVDHVFAGQMGPETLHFLECVMRDREPMVSPESARRVMECYLAADLSAESGEPIDVPLNNQSLAAVQDLYKKVPHAGVAPCHEPMRRVGKGACFTRRAHAGVALAGKDRRGHARTRPRFAHPTALQPSAPSSSGLTGRSSNHRIFRGRTLCSNRQAGAYWIVRSSRTMTWLGQQFENVPSPQKCVWPRRARPYDKETLFRIRTARRRLRGP